MVLCIVGVEMMMMFEMLTHHGIELGCKALLLLLSVSFLYHLLFIEEMMVVLELSGYY